MTERAGPGAGPETAAEHIRNALQLLQLRQLGKSTEFASLAWAAVWMESVDAARARLTRALAALERVP